MYPSGAIVYHELVLKSLHEHSHRWAITCLMKHKPSLKKSSVASNLPWTSCKDCRFWHELNRTYLLLLASCKRRWTCHEVTLSLCGFLTQIFEQRSDWSQFIFLFSVTASLHNMCIPGLFSQQKCNRWPSIRKQVLSVYLTVNQSRRQSVNNGQKCLKCER